MMAYRGYDYLRLRGRGYGVLVRGGNKARNTDRLLWADTAKGLSIMGVCLLHSGVPDDSFLSVVSQGLGPIRMPLFFLVAGIFAHRVIERTLGDLWYRRLWFLLVPYLVFTPFEAAYRLNWRGDLDLPNMLLSILVGSPGLWFLHVLIVFNVAACLLRRLPPVWAVAASVAPAVLVYVFDLNQYSYSNEIIHMITYAPAFFLGLYGRDLWFWLAGAAVSARTRLIVLAGAVGLYAAWWAIKLPMIEHFRDVGWDTRAQVVNAMVGICGAAMAVPLGIVIAAWLARIPGVSTVFAVVGRHTLPIYVSHQAMMYVVRREFVPWLVEQDADRWGFLTEDSSNFVIGVLTCIASGFLFYWLGTVPATRWILYPPPFPRRSHTPAGAGELEGDTRDTVADRESAAVSSRGESARH